MARRGDPHPDLFDPDSDPTASPLQPAGPWTATREEGLRRLAAFAQRMGGVYKSGRNADLGPERRIAVSVLSPYIRRRLVTEREAVAAALERHSASAAEKFVQEVFWRTYWKGWLEMRPSVWQAYRKGVRSDRKRLAHDARLADRVATAEDGRTGVACFDAWAQELDATGYLHNHARMWFASIWIFTLDLPWRLGADLFLRKLLDGDAASNTLGWRWVAGLQTRGKNYVARAGNIAKHTEGRFFPEHQLASAPPPLVDDAPPPPAAPPRDPRAPERGAPTLLILTDDDCALEQLEAIQALDVRAVVALPTAHRRSDAPLAPAVAAFDAQAMADAAARLRAPTPMMLDDHPEALATAARDAGAAQTVAPFAPVGWTAEALDAARSPLERAGAPLCEIGREWDRVCWPTATAGFFKFKEKIPRFVSRLM